MKKSFYSKFVGTLLLIAFLFSSTKLTADSTTIDSDQSDEEEVETV